MEWFYLYSGRQDIQPRQIQLYSPPRKKLQCCFCSFHYYVRLSYGHSNDACCSSINQLKKKGFWGPYAPSFYGGGYKQLSTCNAVPVGSQNSLYGLISFLGCIFWQFLVGCFRYYIPAAIMTSGESIYTADEMTNALSAVNVANTLHVAPRWHTKSFKL